MSRYFTDVQRTDRLSEVIVVLMQITKSSILVADDEDNLRAALSYELENAGYEVTAACDGDEAIAALKAKKFDLALLDIKMPKMDGMQVLKYIRQEVPGTKVVMLTAYADLRHAIESKKNGADDFMSKPYAIEDLLMTIQRLLNS
ncbi:MAG: response regulator [Ignavibacteria bacterium]|nr:response regulator [Ignavibacteria bacterium]